MQNKFAALIIGVAVIAAFGSCKKGGDAGKGDVWPKNGFLITTNGDGDTVYVEGSNMALTSPYAPGIGDEQTQHLWTITLPTSGDGALIHNENGRYWYIDSAFHPGLNVEQHFIALRNTNEPGELSNLARFKYHKADDDGGFYIESVSHPGTWVVALGHAEAGRGLRLRAQSAGNWKFWLASR